MKRVPFRVGALGAMGAIGAATLLAAAQASAATLVRAPYIQSVSPTGAVVVWTTAAAGPAELKHGATPGALTTTVTGPSATQHEVKLSGLQPDSVVCYSVGEPGQVLAGGDATHCFRTAPTAGTKKKLRAWIVGDSGSGDSVQAAVRDAMLGAVGKTRPTLFLHMGDMAYDAGTTAEFTTNFFAMYPTVLAGTALFPTMGNHEGMSSDSGTQTGPYYTAYVLPKGGESGGLPSGTEAYYAYDWGNVHFIVLDSHDSSRSPTGPMLTWLKADLAATKQDFLVAYWHHPPYTKGSHDSDTESQLVEMRENALPILEAAGVDLVLAGHSHIYERSFLIDGAYDTPTVAAGKIKDPGDGKPLGSGPYAKKAGNVAHDGAVYVVAGHGGTGVSGTGGHPVMVKSELANGSCVLDVQGNRLSLFNVRSNGQITDRFTIVKGTGLVVASPDGGETYAPGTTTDIQWATVGTVGMVKLELSLDDGKSWSPIAGPLANTGKHTWTVPATTSDTALVRVVDAANGQVSDESNGVFTIGGPVKVIPSGSVWKYWDDAKDPGAAWATSGFDDAAWKSGPGQLGYGDGDEATVLAETTPARPSQYFRRTVDVAGKVSSASIKVVHDDGVAVFVNGKQVFSKYVNDLAHGAYASMQSADNETSTASVDETAFVPGKNVVAAVVKQAGATSSDVSFDLELTLTEVSQGTGGAGGSGTAGAGGTGTSGGAGSPAQGGAGGKGGSATAGGGAGAQTTGPGGSTGVGTAGSGAAGSGASAAPAASSDDGGGCGCNVGGTSDASLFAVAGALALLSRRRRR